MIKTVIPASWDSIGEAGARLVFDVSDLTKVANTIFGMDYADMKPDKDHVGIHLVALGDYEHFGLNRNFDGFSKVACTDFTPTFVELGKCFEHHKNGDPKVNVGEIKKAAYNEKMGRVELFIHAHKERAKKHLERLEKEGSVPVSMACRVDYDTCNVCGARRKNRHDDTTCDHLRYQFGKEAEDGTIIGTMNPEPKWFDISFVTKPADRIAWDLKKVASESDKNEYFRKWAEDLESGLTVPAHVLMSTELAREKLACMQKLVDAEAYLKGNATGKQGRAYLELVKQAAASSDISVADIERLRDIDPAVVFNKLAEHGVIMSPRSFLQYVFGTGMEAVKDYADGAIAKCAEISAEVLKSPVNTCTNARYDIQSVRGNLPHDLAVSVCKAASVLPEELQNRMLFAEYQPLTNNSLDKMASASVEYALSIAALAEEYVAYKVAALNAITKNVTSHKEQDSVFAVAAAQNLYRSNTSHG